MLDIVNVPIQTVNDDQSVLFANTRVHRGCNERHEQGSGRVVLLKAGVYMASFNASVAVPTGGVAGPVSLGIMQDGEIVAGSVMIVTPTALNAYFNVSTTNLVNVFCNGNSTISVVILNTTPILVQNANLVVTREC